MTIEVLWTAVVEMMPLGPLHNWCESISRDSLMIDVPKFTIEEEMIIEFWDSKFCNWRYELLMELLMTRRFPPKKSASSTKLLEIVTVFFEGSCSSGVLSDEG